jgi:hypothetical protein
MSVSAYAATAVGSYTGNSVIAAVYAGPNSDTQYVYNPKDGDYLGPESFSLKSDGGFYLLDTAKKKVLSYNASGKKEGCYPAWQADAPGHNQQLVP